MTHQESLTQRLKEIAGKVQDGMYGEGDNIDLLSLEEDLGELTELVDDDDEP